MADERVDAVGTPGSKTVEVYIDGKSFGKFQRECQAAQRAVDGFAAASFTLTRTLGASRGVLEHFRRIARRAVRPAPDWLGDLPWHFPTWRPLARPYDWRFDDER